MPGLAPTASTADLSGRVSGAVFAAIRRHLEKTQDDFAELLGVSLATIQAWEQGRKPLVNASFTRLRQLRWALSAAGANEALLHLWEKALDADVMLAGFAVEDPGTHPLAMVVPDRLLTSLLAWPLSGEPPRELGVVSASLVIPAGERDDVAFQLRAVVEHADLDDPRSAMLRRQVKYLVAANPGSLDWVAEQDRIDTRLAKDLRDWTPDWPVARSAAVAASHRGELDPLARFIQEGLSNDAQIAANLNYWAYWVGEHSSTWDADNTMTTSTGWSGEKLLASLTDGIQSAPYRNLSAHTLWALLRTRRHLAVPPRSRHRIARAVERAMDDGQLDEQARERLNQVRYLVGSE